ncbi:FAD-dependent oxidoreductase [Microbacterium sp. CFH 31415]|uniref:protoporphyrinogen/coproporphyrinogen oxidase n=1 Tax=Microbacterium sp. CFH 31415 TaxID=2921732 RepID=UPI001F144940|nr:FAD-dependent oxidoreductase [Microbacterium sp. CFH 31415]MCH6231698.1 FAD-dependent oxidoreductase [Microbacterium sp. CFH 31415]
MSETPEPLDELVTHAHDTRVVVVGAGIAGLVAALECAKVGMPVTVLEAAGRAGGTIAEAEVGGLRVDLGASSWSTANGAVDALVDELGLSSRVVEPAETTTWIAGLGRSGAAAASLPAESVLGIPANPWSEEVRPFIGLNGAWRAYLDRLRPPLTIGKERNLDRLVRTRMGDAVVDRMVAPLSVGRFGITPSRVDVAAAAPGLSSALTRTGSLGGAVADLLVDRASGPRLKSLEGGMLRLVDALVEKLTTLGAEVVTGARVTAVERDADARWAVSASDPAGEPIVVEPADVLFVATGQADARRLLPAHLAPSLDESMTDAAPLREIVTLVVDAPALDAAPRGAEVYAVPGTRRASGLVHQTARWAWLARAAGPGRHVLSVAFDAASAPGADAGPDAVPNAGLDDAAVAELARGEASALLGIDIDEAAVRGAHRAVFTLAHPASAIGHSEATEAVRRATAAARSLAAVGSWLAGSGLAQVVADAQAEAERVRRIVLWGSAPGS